MAVKLIAENILKAEDFLSATEQEGKYIGQPVPDSANTGAFRLLSKGDENGNIADFTYNGTATSNGAADGTTVIDSILAAFGDNYFIGGTVTVNEFLQDADTGDYTEQDVVANRIALTDAATVTITSLDTDEECWVVIDRTADHYSGDFAFYVDVRCTAIVEGEEVCAVWAVANSVDTLHDIDVANGDFLAVYWFQSGGQQYLKVEECNGGALTVDTSINLAVGTQYYLDIVRDESVGAYGVLYCYIYSDADHTILVDTISVVLTEKQNFQYLYWMNSYEPGAAGFDQEWSGIISNLRERLVESASVTDFTQLTGTITTTAFSLQVITGTVFTLTVPYATRDFHVELITSGDAGDAAFKWSHDGGTNYLGRDDPNQVDWLAESEIFNNIKITEGRERAPLIQADDGTWITFFQNAADDYNYCKRSTDNGLTWGTIILVGTAGTSATQWALKLNSGRILAHVGINYASYSDDHGISWSTRFIVGLSNFRHVIELKNGIIIGFAGITDIQYKTSNDGGFTWVADPIVAVDDANTQKNPSFVELDNGDWLLVYTTDEDVLNDFEIKCKISSDQGATWGAAIDVLDRVGNDINHCHVIKYIDGELYCVAREDSADTKIIFTVSDDQGLTWGANKDLKSVAVTDLDNPYLCLIDGHIIVCTYVDDTNSDVDCVRRGIWEVYVGPANACPCAVEAIEQKLICDVGIIWYGGAGEDGDIWQFETEYDFAMSNMISDSPSKFWRSEQDNIACRIVIDMGANERFLADGIGFFNCNVRTLSFQANTTNVWTAPLVDESISFDLVTGVVDYITGNAVEDDSLLGNYDDHYFKTDNYYLRMTSGTDDGETWKILDNVGGYIFLDTTAAVNIAADDTFVIFQGWTAKTFTNRMPYRFLSIYIAAQKTAEGYYKIGFTPIGKTVTLDRRWTGGYGNPHVYNVDLLQTPQGGLIPIKHAERYREFELTWPFSENTRKQLVTLLDYLDRKNICLIPDDSTDNQGLANCFIECYLVKLIGGLEQTGGFDKRLDIKLRFREIL